MMSLNERRKRQKKGKKNKRKRKRKAILLSIKKGEMKFII